MTRRFGELAIGTRFCFRARRYEKVATEIGRDEERGGNVFHARTEVMVEILPACSAERTRNAVASVPPATREKDHRRTDRKRLPEMSQRESALSMLRELCPPHHYTGPCCDGSEKRTANGKEDNGTGN
jgi:hypothetical protein